MEEITVDAADILGLFQEKVNIMIDLVEHMPDEHKLELWTVWLKMTEKIKYLIRDVMQPENLPEVRIATEDTTSTDRRIDETRIIATREPQELESGEVAYGDSSAFDHNTFKTEYNNEESLRRTSRTARPSRLYRDYMTITNTNKNSTTASKKLSTKTSTPVPCLQSSFDNSSEEQEMKYKRLKTETSISDQEKEYYIASEDMISSPSRGEEQNVEVEKYSTKEPKAQQKRGRKRKLEYTFSILADGRCRCSICDKVLGNRSNAIAHSRIHSGERPYRCLICAREFTTKPNLRRHELTHEGVKNYECPECHKRFSEKKSVKLHLLTHSGERPYKCDMCDAAFRQLGTLQAHRHIHTGYKGHVCDICGKAFRQKSQMKLHQLRHQNKRTFECDACEKSYFSKGDLNRHHIAVHSVSRPFNCQMCDKQFTRLQYFKDHMNIHTGLKPYNCGGCNAFFAEYRSMYKHMSSCEKIKELGLVKRLARVEEDENDTGQEETVEVLTSAEENEQVIQIVSKTETGEENTCVLYVDSDEFANQVAGSANFVITGLNQGEGSTNVVIMEQVEENSHTEKTTH